MMMSALGFFERAPAMYPMSHWSLPFSCCSVKMSLPPFKHTFLIPQTYRGSVASQKLYIVVVFVPCEHHVASNLYNLHSFQLYDRRVRFLSTKRGILFLMK